MESLSFIAITTKSTFTLIGPVGVLSMGQINQFEIMFSLVWFLCLMAYQPL